MSSKRRTRSWKRKPTSDYWQPNEAQRFSILYALADGLLEAHDELTDPATLARVSSSEQTEQALVTLLGAITIERGEWLALARERASSAGEGGEDAGKTNAL